MKRNLLAALGALIIAVTAASPSLAQTPQPVELKGDVKVRQRVIENGAEKQILAEPKVVVPGDTLLFTTAYRNVSSQAVKNFVITNALPGGVALAPEGAASQMVSVDGGKTWGALGTLSVNGNDGTKRPTHAGDVTHLRWILTEIKPGVAGEVTYLALVR